MSWLIETALRLRVIVVVAAIIFLAVGLRVARTTPYDVFPEFAPPFVEVQTEAPGLSAEEVEALVTVPLESALNGTAWLETLRSESVLGLSSVVLIFQDGTDLLRARQLVQERVAVIAALLPAIAKTPVILPPVSSTSRVLKIGMTSHELSQMELTELARWTVRPRLMAIPGVANVAIWGERDQQLHVIVDPDRLRAVGVTLDGVVRAATSAVAVGGGGFIDTPNQRLVVRHLSPIVQPDDLARTVVRFSEGAALRLGDVATVEIGFPPPIGDAVINDRAGLLLTVEKQPWGNTLDVTRKIDETLQALVPGLSGVELDATIFRPATFIERSLSNLRRAMLFGCVLVVAVLVAFLFEWRAALISLAAIPLSLVGALIALRAWGSTLDTMALAGLVVAVGEVVDDAIIDVENIARRLRMNAAAGGPLSAFQVVYRASLEVRSSVVFASLIVILVFVPVFFLPGVAGAFFRPLAVAYVLAIVASLVVALTVTPALSLMLLPGAAARTDGPLARALRARYRGLLPGIVARPRRALTAVVAAFALTLIAVPFLGEEFLPRFRETDFLMHWVGKPGTTLEAMRRVTLRVSDELRAIPGVRNFGAHIGRAEAADEVVGPNFAELWISVGDEVDYDRTVATVQRVVDGYPGLYHDVLTYLRERITEVLTGAQATVVVRIYGPDLQLLRAKAEEVSAAIADVPGVKNLKVETQELVPQIEVRVRPEAATVFGLTPGDVRGAVTTLVQGRKVGELFHDQRVVDVVVQGAARIRSDPQALRDTVIDTPSGAVVPLRDVAELAIVPAQNEIKREGASRRIDVLCDVAGSDLKAVADAIEARVRTVAFDREYHPEFLGEYAASTESRRRLLALGALSLVGILVVLHADFQSLRLTLLVLLTLPFALVGGVLGAFVSGGVLSLGSLVGLVTVLGIAARNGIMLVSHYRHLEEVEGEPFGMPLILRGAEERLAPILMTALCAALALVPLVAAGHVPGHEIEHPMAVVILGGLASSTALNLLLLPTFYAALGGRKARERDGEARYQGNDCSSRPPPGPPR